ncbi:cytochrome P450 3A30 [Lophiostoma macrostomum CBS 122681]|uniref:Cytochrome P450 3A30 n=1 Tax=Lophiostoma macrostomum CBS 122681 TaxID=1314788 RepID=A0A6A6TRV5_9PLEO|nr:cytochrome P450 3A30 [Lophiostoma macrostomum CBS 122681]
MSSLQCQSLPLLVLSGMVATVFYWASKLIRHRRSFKGLPMPPHDFLWGHLKLLGELTAMFPLSVHHQNLVTTMKHKYKLPGVFYLDLWPLGPSQVVVTDPDVALHMTAVKNHPKHPDEAYYIDPVGGKGNIVASNGPLWKHLHQMLAPAFAISRVRSTMGMVAEDVMTFHSIIKDLATSGKTFSMEELTNNLSFMVITKAIFGFALGSQDTTSPAWQDFSIIRHAWAVQRDGFNPVKIFFARRKRLAATKRLDALLSGLLRDRFKTLEKDQVDVSHKQSLSIMDLVLRDRLEEMRKSGADSTYTLDPQFVELAVTQIKTLLVAATGTTSDTLCFAYMLLSKQPEVVSKLRAEHSAVFCPGIQETYAMLQEKDHVNKLSELEYTDYVIKETLRLYPIGHTARAEDDTGFLMYDGRPHSTKGLMICPVQHTMHYDSKIFPNASRFDPDRFARDESPRHAWRPFERGSRGCLGQALAMDEMKLVLLLTVRDFDFECVGLKPNKEQRVPWTDLDLTFGDLAFQEFVFEAQPRDGMPMKASKVE